MATFAKISDSNQVLAVVIVSDSDTQNAEGVEEESVGQAFLEKNNNWPAAMWIQTSYNTWQHTHSSGDNSKAFRGNYASVGFTWDADNEVFWPIKPFDSWVKHTETASWKSPIGDAPALPSEKQAQNNAKSHAWGYQWNETDRSWDLVDAVVPS